MSYLPTPLTVAEGKFKLTFVLVIYILENFVRFKRRDRIFIFLGLILITKVLN